MFILESDKPKCVITIYAWKKQRKTWVGRNFPPFFKTPPNLGKNIILKGRSSILSKVIDIKLHE